MEAKQFHVEVIDVVENEDGSATVVLDMDSEAAQAFLSLGVLRAIELGLDATEEEHKRRTGGVTMDDALARLVRIMGTFDLATGHADTMDQALDALEEELRDVLGHLRAGDGVILNVQSARIKELEERVSWLETTLDTVDAALGKWRETQ